MLLNKFLRPLLPRKITNTLASWYFSSQNSSLREVKIDQGPNLSDFIESSSSLIDENQTQMNLPTSLLQSMTSVNKRVYIKTYGCQMNVNDSEIVRSILIGSGFEMEEEDMAKVFLSSS